MRPNIGFHGVQMIAFSPVRRYKRDDGTDFWSRRLTIANEDGEQFEMSLFSNSDHGLRVIGDDELDRAVAQDGRA